MHEVLLSTFKPTDCLGQFFTSPSVGELLISKITEADPQLILDLGSGNGVLSSAALRRWSRASLISVDIDEHVGARSRLQLVEAAKGRYAHIHADVLSSDLSSRLGVLQGSVDVTVCNPPYSRLRWRKHFDALLDEVGLRVLPPSNEIPAEVLFIAQNLRLLGKGGQAGLIVPDALISGIRYAPLRRALVREHSVKSVIQLPLGSFVGTEARAHIVILTKRPSQAQTVELALFSEEKGLGSSIQISFEQAENRLDFDYHSTRMREIGSGRALKDIATAINRGTLNSSEIRATKVPTFHLNNFAEQDNRKKVRLRGSIDILSKTPKRVVARPGDILLARVGRQLENQVCEVDSGYALLSDCVYRIEVPQPLRRNLLNHLSSERGRALLRSAAHGSAARHLSKQDLLSLFV